MRKSIRNISLAFLIIFFTIINLKFAFGDVCPPETSYADCVATLNGLPDMGQASPQEVAAHFDMLNQEKRAQLSSEQLSEVIAQKSPSTLGDLSQYNPVALAQALQSQGYDVSRLGGNIAGARFEGNTLVIGNSHFDAKTGKPFFSDN